MIGSPNARFCKLLIPYFKNIGPPKKQNLLIAKYPYALRRDFVTSLFLCKKGII